MKTNKFNIANVMTFLFIIAMLSSKAKDGKIFKNENSNQLILKIEYKEAKKNDTLFLYVSNRFAGGLELGSPKVYQAVKRDDGLFLFDVPAISNKGYFMLYGLRSKVLKSGRNLMPLLWPQFWEKGDSVFLELSHKETSGGISSTCTFSGHGSGKYTARQEISQQNERAFNLPLLSTLNYGSYPLSSNVAIQKLNQYRQSMSNISFEVLKGDLHFSQYHGMFAALKIQYDSIRASGNLKLAKAFKSSFYKKFEYEVFPEFKNSSLSNTSEFLGYCFEKSKFIAYLENNNYSSSDLFDILINQYFGEIRDVLLIKYLQDSKRSGSPLKEFEKAESLIKDKECKRILEEMRTSLPGREFKDYYLIDITGKKVKLSDYDDKIVMVDFWFTGCGGCSLYFKNTISKAEEHFKGNPKIVFLSISIDKNTKNWKESVAGGEYTSDLAVNLFTSTIGVEHPITRENWIRDFPFAILLGRGLVIKEYNSQVLYSYESLVEKIASLL